MNLTTKATLDLHNESHLHKHVADNEASKFIAAGIDTNTINIRLLLLICYYFNSSTRFNFVHYSRWYNKGMFYYYYYYYFILLLSSLLVC